MTIPLQLDPHALAAELSNKNLIGGELVPASSGKTFDVINPATMETIATTPFSDATDVDRAVQNAKTAQKAWAKMNARDRGKLVAACGTALMERVEEMGRLIALETGKAIRTESRPEASVLADVFIYFGGLASELKGESIPFNNETLTVTVRQPIGVIGAIIPWNAPLLLMALKIAPALVAGNSVVVKSAEEAPLGVLRVAQVMNEILPPGVFNILSGFGPEAGAPLVEHKSVGKVSFTGSVDTGRIVYKTAAERIVPCTLELGGKSPMIVMADADLDRAVAGALTSMRFTRQGQSCTAASRIFVHEDLHDAFVEKMVAAVNAMKMGDPMDEETDIGSVISPQQFQTVQKYIGIGKDTAGATAHVCSALPTDARFSKGLFVQPVIFTGTRNTDQINQEEIFGPVTCVIPWRDYEDVIAQANDTQFGLAASVWTNNLKLAMDAVHRIEAGFCQVNQNVVVQAGLSYGGVKTSGLGKEASLESMLEHFTQKKTIIINMT